jgi:hypothetical protein
VRAILTSAFGVRCDISQLVTSVIEHGQYDDFRDVLTTRYLSDIGRKLVLVGGRMGPMAVFVALEEHMPPAYARHVASIWGLVDFDDSDVDPDDIPTISLAGPPPARRLRTTAG